MTDDAQDFGECLVEIRDALEVELPLRVKPVRVYLGAAVEALSVFVLRTFRMRFRSIITTRPDPDELLQPMMRKFETLRDRVATRIQAEQTQAFFHEEFHRRVRHIDREMALWHRALASGLYTGTLVFTLFVVSVLMCIATNRDGWISTLIVSFALLQALCALIILRGWLCRQP